MILLEIIMFSQYFVVFWKLYTWWVKYHIKAHVKYLIFIFNCVIQYIYSNILNALNCSFIVTNI